MKYYSTRDASVRMDSAEAIEMGLSRDGGLLTPWRSRRSTGPFWRAW